MRRLEINPLAWIALAAPLLPVATGLVVGIVADSRLAVPPSVYAAIFGLGVLAILALPRMGHAIVLITFALSVCLGGLLHYNDSRRVSARSIARYCRDDRVIARLTGVVASAPRLRPRSESIFARWMFDRDRSAFLMEVESIEASGGPLPVEGRVRVSVGEAVLDLRHGERIEVFGHLYRFPESRNPGGFDRRDYFNRNGIVAGFHCAHREAMRRLDSDPPANEPLVGRFRRYVSGLLTDDLITGGAEDQSLLETMVLGQRSRLDRKLNEVFLRAGCMHFLAVSGVHVGIVMGTVGIIARLVGMRRRRVAWLMIAAVVLYASITEPRPSILRATVMAILFCLSLILRRPRSSLNWICAAAAVLLMIRPSSLYDPGFQLSFVAVLGVIYLGPALTRAYRSAWLGLGRLIRPTIGVTDEEGRDRLNASSRSWSWRVFWPVLMMSTAAWLATLPVVAGHFHRIQWWAAPNSCVVMPLVTVVMFLGFAKTGLTALAPSLGQLAAPLLVGADRLLIGMVELLARLPGASTSMPAMPGWLVGLYYLLLGSWIWRFRREPDRDPDDANQIREPGQSRRRSTAAVVVTCCLVAAGAFWWTHSRSPGGRLRVTALAVGAGTATVIELPDGRVHLYDVGTMGPFDVGRHVVVPFLRSRGQNRIDKVYISHTNLDHFSGLPSLAEAMSIGSVVINTRFERHARPGTPARRLLEWLEAHRIPMEVLDVHRTSWTESGVRFDQLWPTADAPADLDCNDSSMVLRLTYAGRSILLTGDVEDAGQRGLLAGDGYAADVLALPHHGSVRTSSESFLAAGEADVLIRSSNQRMVDTRSGLDAMAGDRRLLNTADCGAVQILVSPAGLEVRPWHAPGG